MNSDKILVVAFVVNDKVTATQNTLSDLASEHDLMGFISGSLLIGNINIP